ncbi:glycosyltransferase [Granulicella sp. L46]|uniref:glycosyltransferase n=1 Tax=Granulicella sp. L46 TaxID=1641865 RepID=UPI00131C1238|nr:glycosyltransferase [Granulicella sp. L46]
MKILAIVVRYKTPIEQSHTLRSLSEAFSSEPELLGNYDVLLWDNSPMRLENPQLSFPFQYNFSDQNVGVAGAYNRALAHAESIGTPWLLLLDQDTIVTAHYLRRMLGYAKEVESDQSIATIVPFVRSHDSLFSPRKLGRFIRSHVIPRSVSGIYRKEAYAANSGTVMRVSALRAVDGYSQEFWLDFSDIYIFHALYRHGKYMYIAGDVELSHSLASMNFDQEVGLERYRSFLAAENAYVVQYRSSLANLAQTFWLAGRVVRQYQRYNNKQFARITMNFLGQRIFWSKSSCLANWKDILRKGRSIPAIAEGKVIG